MVEFGMNADDDAVDVVVDDLEFDLTENLIGGEPNEDDEEDDRWLDGVVDLLEFPFNVDKLTADPRASSEMAVWKKNNWV